MLHQLCDALWSLSWSGLFCLDSTAHTAQGIYRLNEAGDIVRICFTRSELYHLPLPPITSLKMSNEDVLEIIRKNSHHVINQCVHPPLEVYDIIVSGMNHDVF